VDGFLILSIETSTGCGSVALTRGGRLLAEVTAQPEVTHSRRLLGTVSWLMRAADVAWPDLDGIAVSLGPGSFTGLRIGMAAAKGLAMAIGIPLLGVETLDALALSCSAVVEQICPVLDARKQEVYAALFQPEEDDYPLRLTDDKALRPEVLISRIDRPTVLAGPAVSVYGDLFKKNSFIRLIPASLAHPRALYVGLLACRMLASGQDIDPAIAAPKYVRLSEAEINMRNMAEIE
jgi:tRNA threonylcarbamoyladenosine biosynthesis protein TsaB